MCRMSLLAHPPCKVTKFFLNGKTFQKKKLQTNLHQIIADDDWWIVNYFVTLQPTLNMSAAFQFRFRQLKR